MAKHILDVAQRAAGGDSIAGGQDLMGFDGGARSLTPFFGHVGEWPPEAAGAAPHPRPRIRRAAAGLTVARVGSGGFEMYGLTFEMYGLTW